MIRIFINRLASSQCLRTSLTGPLRPAIVTRLLGRPEERKESLNNYVPNCNLRMSSYLQSNESMNSLANQKIANEQVETKYTLTKLEAAFSRFEGKCQRHQRVDEKIFVKIFDDLTKTVEYLESCNEMNDDAKLNLSMLTAILLRCCGKLMINSPEKVRELLTGNLWQFIKDKNIPVDISHYNSLIRVLNENRTNFDPQKLLDEIKSANLTPDRVTYQRLIHQYCIQGNTSGATNLLEIMKDSGMELNELIFASLIIGYSHEENPPPISEMFALMKSNGVEPGSRSYVAAIISRANLLSKNPDAAKELEELFQSMKKEEIQFDIYDTIDLVCNLIPHKKNESVAKILNHLGENSVNLKSRYLLFSALFRINEFEEASRLYWLKTPSDKVLEYSNSGSFYIRLLASNENVTPDYAIEEGVKLKESGHNSKPFHYMYFIAAENGRLDLVRACLKKIAEEEHINCLYLWPLIAQSKSEEELVNVLKNDLNPDMPLYGLLETFSEWVWPRFANNISRLFELNKKELHYKDSLLMASFLNYSVQENKINEAIKFISEAPEDIVSNTNADQEESHDADLSYGSSTQPRNQLVGRLLYQIAVQTKDPVMVNKAYNLCMIPGQQVTSNAATALVKVHLLNNDFESALKIFLKLAKENKIAPAKTDLIAHCLENKDPENLQKIMDVSSELYGERNSLFDLAVCCLNLGKLKQAQKIFTGQGVHVAPNRVYRACRNIAKRGDINVLENFVHLTRNMHSVDQEILYQILIDAFDQTSNGKRALDLWNRMQEEDFQPSKRILLMIANVLEKNGFIVPFQKPKLLPRSRDTQPRYMESRSRRYV